jgi:hypothetical protein
MIHMQSCLLDIYIYISPYSNRTITSALILSSPATAFSTMVELKAPLSVLLQFNPLDAVNTDNRRQAITLSMKQYKVPMVTSANIFE